MDETFETPVDESSEFEDISFGKEVAKSLAISAATSAGTLVGMLVAGLAIGKFIDIRDKRRAKKNPDLTEAPVED